MTSRKVPGKQETGKRKAVEKQPPRKHETAIRKAKPSMTGGCYVVENGRVKAVEVKKEPEQPEPEIVEEAE